MQSARGARGTTGAGGSTYATPSASPASQDQQAGLHHYDSRRIQQTRIELAGNYIGAEHRSLTEAAHLLGFAHLSGFSRWRRRWLLPDAAGAGPSTRN